MKIKNIKWITGSLITAALAAGISACTDDHFDISSTAAGKQTIWQEIKSNSQLSEYADILQRVNYSTSEKKTTPETYADLLNGDQTFTVWAPKNGSFDYQYYLDLLESGERENIYKVETELIRNTMTRYSNIMNGSGTKRIDLFNSKSATLDYDNMTINGVKIEQNTTDDDAVRGNIGATNGVLHITEAPVEFRPNLYEYMASRKDLDSLYSFLKSFDKIEFSEAQSTPGPTINGRKTWVDSVTFKYNAYTGRYMGADLTCEDSLYAMVMPNNAAWKIVLSKTKQYFNFKAKYEQDVNTQTETGKDTTIKGKVTEFTQAEIDSLVNIYSKNAICEHLAYNAKWQYEQKPISTIAEVNASDSLHTTGGVKFKKTGTRNATNGTNVLEVDNYGALFGNADPVEVSNGYAYVTNEFTYPYNIYAPELDQLNFESKDNNCDPSYWSMTYTRPTVVLYEEYLKEKENEDDPDEYVVGEHEVKIDSVYKYTFLKMKPTGNNPGAYFKVSNVLSCKYDIYVVINYNTDYNLQNRFYVQVTFDDKNGRRTKDKRLENPAYNDIIANKAYRGSRPNKNHFMNRSPYRNTKGEVSYTDTILVAKDFEFPYCYYGISSDAYPIFNILSNVGNNDTPYYTREIWVNSIIMKPKDTQPIIKEEEE